MASLQAIIDALTILANNYVHINKRDEWIDGNIDLWEVTFLDGKNKDFNIIDKYIRNGASEFCRKVPGDFPPNLHKFYTFLTKEYGNADNLKQDARLKDCPSCNGGFRQAAVHFHSTNERGEYMVKERLYHCACDCPAGEAAEEQGLKNWKVFQADFGDICKDGIYINQDVAYCEMTDALSPELSPRALCSEWRQEKNKTAKTSSGMNIDVRRLVSNLEKAMIKRDKQRMANGQKPVDRMEYITKHAEDYDL